jgi:hypothetical protein
LRCTYIITSMKNSISVILLTLLMSFTSLAQNFINKNKSEVISKLNKYDLGNANAKSTITQTDSSVVMNVSGPGVQPVTFIYLFDADGKCMTERTIANCDSCQNKYLQYALVQKKYKWKKINENQYVSSYKKKRMIELPADNTDKSMTVIRITWTKKIYNMLAGSK